MPSIGLNIQSKSRRIRLLGTMLIQRGAEIILIVVEYD
jgi:hypothetical protein